MISRIVKVYDKATNELLNEFDSIEAVAYEYEISRETVRKSILGKNIRGDVYFRSDEDSPFTNRKTKVFWYENGTDRLLGVYDSALEASQKTNIPVSTIRNNCRGVTKTVCKRKYYFRSPLVEFNPIHPEPYILKGKPKKWLNKAVDVYDATTDELIQTFESYTAAAKFIGCLPKRITENINYIPNRKSYSTIYKKYYCKKHYD